MQSRLWFKVIVRDSTGKVTYCKRRLSHSFLQAWNQLVYLHMTNVAITIKDTGGVNRAIAARNNTEFTMGAGAGIIVNGIVFGLGSNAVTLADFALQTPITEGVGLNQMNYAAVTVGTSAVAAPLCGFTVSRNATNNSGNPITVTEAAIYVGQLTGGWYACVVRDVFVGLVVAGGGVMTVNWTLQVTA